MHKNRAIPPNDEAKCPQKRHLAFFIGLALFLALGSTFLFLGHDEAAIPPADKVLAIDDFDVDMPEPAETAEALQAGEAGTPEEHVSEGVVAAGDTAASILAEALSTQEIHDLAETCRPVFALTALRAGQPYVIRSCDASFTCFEYQISQEEMLFVTRDDAGFHARKEAIAYDLRPTLVTGTIADNLYAAVDAAGEKPDLAIRLADIFAWDVDFVRDLRTGDSFKALVEKRFKDGQEAGYGRVLAAEFTNDGTTFKGFLFEDENGRPAYFDQNGKSLRKALLKAPLKFSRISSGYSMRRLHPVTHQWKAHPAIDYAAPTGTPVMAVGDGTVTTAGWQGGAGRIVSVRHDVGGFETMYLHLSRFARGIKSGSKVSQGQVIGYVGATGVATGPHLDFRMKKGGAWINPQKVITPPAKDVSKNRLALFKQITAVLDSRLQSATAMQTAPAGQAAGGQL